jgi:hypothetical protein
VDSFTSYKHEEGDYWATPGEILERRAGDCDCKSILLCSLLRCYVPADRVFCAVVMWQVNGKEDGHMCVFYQDDSGKDQIIEATAAPEQPVDGSYNLYALFNDQYAFATEAGLELFDLKPIREWVKL